MPPPHPLELTALHQSVLDALTGGYGLFFRQIADQVRATTHPDATDPQLADVVWDLAWSGRLTNDTLTPMRSLLGSGRTAGSTAHRAKRTIPRGRYGSLTAAARPASRTGPPTVAGRWSLLPPREPDPTVRAHALARTLLDRHGVVTRGAVSAEGVEGGFSATYRILSAFEDSGQARRGYVVEGLGAAQFAMDGAVDRLRAVSNARDRGEPVPDSGTPDLWGSGSVPEAPHGPAQGDPEAEDWDWTRAFDDPDGRGPEAGPGFASDSPSPASRDEYISPRDYPPQPTPQHWQATPGYGSGFGSRRHHGSDASRAVVLAAADPANAYGAALPWPDPRPRPATSRAARRAPSWSSWTANSRSIWSAAARPSWPGPPPPTPPPPTTPVCTQRRSPSPRPPRPVPSARSRWNASTAPRP